MRAAIYARYSSDLQSPRSIDDQNRICREHAERIGADVVKMYSDKAISGAHAVNRPGLLALMEDAARGTFDVVIAEAMDRLSRSLKDMADIQERLEYAGVSINTVSENQVDIMTIGFKGTMNASMLRELKAKIHRGMSGRVEDGLSAGGICYGYRVPRIFDAKGEPVRGMREVIPEQADVIRRIFAEYISGKSPKKIAWGLNRDGIPSPSGGEWTASSVYGDRKRGNGVLRQEAYIGLLVWNRTRMVKNPDTGKRQSRMNPPDDWQFADKPEWRIIDDDTWDAAQAILEVRGGARPERQRRPKRILSGLVTCGVCGGAFTVISRDRFGCSASRQKGTCQNTQTVSPTILEERVFKGLQNHLMTPDRVQELIRSVHQEIKNSNRQAASRRTEILDVLKKNDTTKQNLVRAIEGGLFDDDIKSRINALNAERDALQQELDDIADPIVIEMIPNLPERYAAKVAELRAAVADDSDRDAAIQVLQSIFAKVVFYPGKKRGEFNVDVHTHVPNIFGIAASPVTLTPGMYFNSGSGGGT